MTRGPSRPETPDTDNGPDIRRLDVPAESAGMRLDRWLAEAEADLSRSRIQSLIRDGQVRIGARTVSDPSQRVKPMQQVVLEIPPAEPAEPVGQDIALEIVYEDSALIVIDKPAGMVVHPAPGNPDGTLVNALIGHCGATLTGIGGVQRPGIVHRIDKDTSGLLVAAKTAEAHEGLSRQFADHSIERSYRALVWGVPGDMEGTIDRNIGRHPKDRKRYAVVAPPAGKHAVTHFRVIRFYGLGASLIECRLETGRTHQIRVHMAAISHPLIGDPVYGGNSRARAARIPVGARDAVLSFPRQALHAASLGFHHPVTGEWLKFASQIPTDMKKLLERLEDK